MQPSLPPADPAHCAELRSISFFYWSFWLAVGELKNVSTFLGGRGALVLVTSYIYVLLWAVARAGPRAFPPSFSLRRYAAAANRPLTCCS